MDPQHASRGVSSTPRPSPRQAALQSARERAPREREGPRSSCCRCLPSLSSTLLAAAPFLGPGSSVFACQSPGAGCWGRRECGPAAGEHRSISAGIQCPSVAPSHPGRRAKQTGDRYAPAPLGASVAMTATQALERGLTLRFRPRTFRRVTHKPVGRQIARHQGRHAQRGGGWPVPCSSSSAAVSSLPPCRRRRRRAKARLRPRGAETVCRGVFRSLSHLCSTRVFVNTLPPFANSPSLAGQPT